MQIHICAVGRLKAGPERLLLDDYRMRFNKLGRSMALGPMFEHEVDERKAFSMKEQAKQLRRLIPERTVRIALDERGQVLSSPQFAEMISSYRDSGTESISFIIGGADGIDPSLRCDMGVCVSFGSMVWPHMLVRVMLAEQTYRAASIMAGMPYHRE